MTREISPSFSHPDLQNGLNCRLAIERSAEYCVCYVCGRTAYTDVRAFCACRFFNKLRVFNTGLEFDSPRLHLSLH